MTIILFYLSMMGFGHLLIVIFYYPKPSMGDLRPASPRGVFTRRKRDQKPIVEGPPIQIHTHWSFWSDLACWFGSDFCLKGIDVDALTQRAYAALDQRGLYP